VGKVVASRGGGGGEVEVGGIHDVTQERSHISTI
jgi:hypothetical protein